MAELKAYRRDLERAIAFFGRQDPVPAVRADLQAALDAVRAEQDDRTSLAASGKAGHPGTRPDDAR